MVQPPFRYSVRSCKAQHGYLNRMPIDHQVASAVARVVTREAVDGAADTGRRSGFARLRGA